MNSPALFYQQQLQKFADAGAKIKKQLLISSLLRLAVFCLAAAAIYIFFGNVKAILAIVLAAAILFLYLITRHSNLQYNRDRIQALIAINKTEIAVLQRKYSGLPEGNAFKNDLHYFSQDIDLFGKGSFYQYANRTALPQGSETLASWFTANTIDHIAEKQKAIQELATLPEWRQNFSAIATLATVDTSIKSIVGWVNGYTIFVPKIMRLMPYIFSGLSIIIGIGYFMGLVSGFIPILWLLLGLVISGSFGSKISKLTANASKAQSTFQQYNKLISLIEDTEFKASYLKIWRAKVVSDGEKTSTVIKKFAGALNSLDKNNNIFYLIFANGLFLRTLTHCYEVEVWIKKYGSSVENWFNTIAFFDAMNSLGNFGFNHPKYTYPTLVNTGGVIEAAGAGHPLLDPKKSVLNDFKIDKEQFFIITGANMAGKSTFLRSVSLQIVMANVGLPVCATSVNYTPIKLITSMRTTDSLTDDESYFFSELKRLKFIVDQVQKENYFIVLDEILKGTNSTDKAEGSRKFVERLVGAKATGIIATHDLSLCEVSKTLPQVENHYFDAEIINDELHFDYTFKTGICQNMNASFLLRKMKIVN